jgi:hypothetical protein
MFKARAMKKVRTFKELQNHPFVSEVWIEDSEGVIDGCDQAYWVELVEGKVFKNLGTIAICEGSKQKLVEAFNHEINFK